MKTTNNVQKTVNGQVRRMTLCAGSILLGVVLMSSAHAANAKDSEHLVQLQGNATMSQSILSPAEVFSAQEADLQVERFADKLMNLQKRRLASSLAPEESLVEAEIEISKEADAQIVKYAQKQLDLQQVKMGK